MGCRGNNSTTEGKIKGDKQTFIFGMALEEKMVTKLLSKLFQRLYGREELLILCVRTAVIPATAKGTAEKHWK